MSPQIILFCFFAFFRFLKTQSNDIYIESTQITLGNGSLISPLNNISLAFEQFQNISNIFHVLSQKTEIANKIIANSSQNDIM